MTINLLLHSSPNVINDITISTILSRYPRFGGPEYGPEQVDGSAADDERGDADDVRRPGYVSHGHAHLHRVHVDLVGQQQVVALGHAARVAEGRHGAVRARRGHVRVRVRLVAAQQQPE